YHVDIALSPISPSYLSLMSFSFQCSAVPRDLHSFPTRRSSDLLFSCSMSSNTNGFTIQDHQPLFCHSHMQLGRFSYNSKIHQPDMLYSFLDTEFSRNLLFCRSKQTNIIA